MSEEPNKGIDEAPKSLWELDAIDLDDVPDISPAQEVFANHYAVYSNGIRAYKMAYPGTKTQAAAVGASDWLKRFPDVRKRILQIRAERLQRLHVDADRVILELAKIAFYDKNMIYSPTGERLRDIETDPDTVNALQPKSGDKIKALELLGKHHRLFIDRVEHEGELTVEVVRFSDAVDGQIITKTPNGTNTDSQAQRTINGVKCCKNPEAVE